jgi:hypothetical protein
MMSNMEQIDDNTRKVVAEALRVSREINIEVRPSRRISNMCYHGPMHDESPRGPIPGDCRARRYQQLQGQPIGVLNASLSIT